MGNNISDKDLEVLMKKAESGDAEAQTQLGYYHRGTGDERQAMAWFTKAANQGNLDAQCEQALYYIRVGGKKFVQKAIECINKAVSQGSPKALDLLGQVYEAGKGVKMNKKRALECYAGAAEKGYVSSYFNAGKIEDEPEKAIEWFSKGAELGDRRCILEMADKYFNGDGVEQDYEKSKALYKKIGAIKVFNQMLPKKMKHLADNSEDEKYEKEIIELMKGHGLKELLLQ
ncbi:MAG: sel1 repeat family protein, partial [Prevotella sp.]|nr:sel1 repeat family protein [Prevotella sp.]